MKERFKKAAKHLDIRKLFSMILPVAIIAGLVMYVERDMLSDPLFRAIVGFLLFAYIAWAGLMSRK